MPHLTLGKFIALLVLAATVPLLLWGFVEPMHGVPIMALALAICLDRESPTPTYRETSLHETKIDGPGR